jgi:lipopolysaccharide export system protein LptA
MNITRLACLVCLAVACKLAAMPSPVSAKPPPPKPSPSLAAAPAPSSTPGCDKLMKVGEVTLCSNEFNFNFKSGDVQFPKPLHGRTSDGTYRADRGYGNLHSQIINLIGHVVVHRDASKDKLGKPVAALTMTADQAHIESKAKFYRTSGNVKIVQGDMTMTAPLIVDDEAHKTINASGGVKIVKGDKTLTAPQIALDETTHVANLTGGVHAEERPDRTFDSTQVLYNTQTQDFKAIGNVRMQFPANQVAPPAPPSPSPKAAPHGPAPSASSSPAASPTPAPGASTAPSTTAAPTLAPSASPSSQSS